MRAAARAVDACGKARAGLLRQVLPCFRAFCYGRDESFSCGYAAVDATRKKRNREPLGGRLWIGYFRRTIRFPMFFCAPD
jgi:hypothetical protein